MLLIIYVTHDGVSRHLMTFNDDRKNFIIYSFFNEPIDQINQFSL